MPEEGPLVASYPGHAACPLETETEMLHMRVCTIKFVLTIWSPMNISMLNVTSLSLSHWLFAFPYDVESWYTEYLTNQDIPYFFDQTLWLKHVGKTEWLLFYRCAFCVATIQGCRLFLWKACIRYVWLIVATVGHSSLCSHSWNQPSKQVMQHDLWQQLFSQTCVLHIQATAAI